MEVDVDGERDSSRWGKRTGITVWQVGILEPKHRVGKYQKEDQERNQGPGADGREGDAEVEKA